jgi:hypothetical protein
MLKINPERKRRKENLSCAITLPKTRAAKDNLPMSYSALERFFNFSSLIFIIENYNSYNCIRQGKFKGGFKKEKRGLTLFLKKSLTPFVTKEEKDVKN